MNERVRIARALRHEVPLIDDLWSMLTLYKLNFFESPFYKLTFHELTFYKLTFYESTFYELTFHMSTFHKLTFYPL